MSIFQVRAGLQTRRGYFTEVVAPYVISSDSFNNAVEYANNRHVGLVVRVTECTFTSIENEIPKKEEKPVAIKKFYFHEVYPEAYEKATSLNRTIYNTTKELNYLLESVRVSLLKKYPFISRNSISIDPVDLSVSITDQFADDVVNDLNQGE